MREKMTLEELQNVELNTLKTLRDFCDAHRLRYYLCGGTLIGAVRHKGFIPWDDDIDVMMPRPDYMELIRLNSDGWLDSHHKLDTLELNDDPLSSVLRIIDTDTTLCFTNSRTRREYGCWIDIFPLDGLSDSKLKRKAQFRCARLLTDFSIASSMKMGGRRRSKLVGALQYAIAPLLPFIRAYGSERWNKALDRLSKRYPYESATYVGVVVGRAGEKEAMLKSRMEPAVEVEFGGEKFTAMANYHEYLTNLYGDYMTPPPEAEKASRHIIDIYWKEGVR